MQTTEALARRIATTEDLSSVVRTMKTLAAVNIRQYEATAESLKEYDQTIRQAVRMLVWNEPTLLQHPPAPGGVRCGLISFGSDQGMCGGFNETVAAEVEQWLGKQTSPSQQIPLIVLGQRLVNRLSEGGHEIDTTVELPGAASGIALMLQQLLPQIDDWRNEHRLGAVVVCHNRRLSQTLYEPITRRLLPIDPETLIEERDRRWSGRSLPLITMPPHQLWQSIARQYLFVALFHACAESQAGENAARIRAMQAAETHIRERLADLNRDYQQLRQTSITEELLDVISGFEALS